MKVTRLINTTSLTSIREEPSIVNNYNRTTNTKISDTLNLYSISDRKSEVSLVDPEFPICSFTPVPEEEMVYTSRVDFIDDYLLYKGEAVPGSAASAAAWRIKRITIGIDGDITEEWAGGNANFDKVWNNRLALSYS